MRSWEQRDLSVLRYEQPISQVDFASRKEHPSVARIFHQSWHEQNKFVIDPPIPVAYGGFSFSCEIGLAMMEW
jgi:hypothetical protein